MSRVEASTNVELTLQEKRQLLETHLHSFSNANAANKKRRINADKWVQLQMQRLDSEWDAASFSDHE